MEKRFYNFTAATTTTMPESWQNVFTNATQPRIAADNSATGRTGEWITMIKVVLQGYFRFGGGQQYARLLIIQVNESGVVQTPTIAIDDPVKSDPHWDSKRWKRILYDRTFYPRGGVILPVIETAGDAVNSPFRIIIRKRLNQHYTGTANTTHGRGSLQFFVIGKNTAGANESGSHFDGYIVYHNQV